MNSCNQFCEPENDAHSEECIKSQPKTAAEALADFAADLFRQKEQQAVIEQCIRKNMTKE